MWKFNNKADYWLFLKTEIISAAEWRARLAARYKDDGDNMRAVVMLRKLARSSESEISDATWKRVKAHLKDDEKAWSWAEAESDIVRAVGHGYDPESLEELLHYMLKMFVPPTAEMQAQCRAFSAALRKRALAPNGRPALSVVPN